MLKHKRIYKCLTCYKNEASDSVEDCLSCQDKFNKKMMKIRGTALTKYQIYATKKKI